MRCLLPKIIHSPKRSLLTIDLHRRGFKLVFRSTIKLAHATVKAATLFDRIESRLSDALKWSNALYFSILFSILIAIFYIFTSSLLDFYILVLYFVFYFFDMSLRYLDNSRLCLFPNWTSRRKKMIRYTHDMCVLHGASSEVSNLILVRRLSRSKPMKAP